MKFPFIAAHRPRFRLRSLCRVLGVSRSGYYAWISRSAPRRAERNAALLVPIRAAYERGRRTMGRRGSPNPLPLFWGNISQLQAVVRRCAIGAS